MLERGAMSKSSNQRRGILLVVEDLELLQRRSDKD